MSTKKLTGVQGLRAIAVIAVVVFHFYPNVMPFGYLGVDLFFVISGFIVSFIYGTNIFSREKIYYFLNKRFLRIYPSLILVLLFVILTSFFLDRSEYLKKSGLEIILSLFSVVNFYFSLFNSEYFKVDVTNNPLLHLWSISTEIQFYLIFPLITLLLGIKMKVFRNIIFLFVIILSFLAYTNIIELQSFSNYYLLYSRIWQFGVGMFAYYVFQHRNIISPFLQNNWKYILYISLTVLMGCFFLQLPFYMNSVLATFFSGALIFFSASHNNDYTFLSNRFIQLLGELSYSIYLWHWVILYFIKKYYYWNLNSSLIGLVITFIISYLSYNYYEVKFRGIEKFQLRNKYYLNLMLVTSVVVFLALISQTSFILSRFENEKQLFSNYKLREGFSILEKQCILDYGENYSKWSNNCMKKRTEKNVLFWGDSHAVALAEAYRVSNVDGSQKVSLLSTSACPPIIDLNAGISPNKLCSQNNNFVFEYIKRNKTKNVVLSSRWFIYANYEWYKSGLQSLQSTIFKLRESGVENIYLVASSPEWQEPLPENLWRRVILFSNFPQYLPNQNISVLNDINYNLNEMAVDAKINYVDPMKVWCDDTNCKTYNSEIFYLNQIDSDHLSVGSATEILKLFKLI